MGVASGGTRLDATTDFWLNSFGFCSTQVRKAAGSQSWGQAAALDNEVSEPLGPGVCRNAGQRRRFDADADWISAAATVVAGKAPVEWDDDDLSRFRRELPLQIAARFSALSRSTPRDASDGGGPFDALRVTITRPDGSEHVGLVDIDQRQRGLVDKAIDEILKELGETIGTPHRVHKALFAVLGDRILSEQTRSEDEAVLVLPERKSRHA